MSFRQALSALSPRSPKPRTLKPRTPPRLWLERLEDRLNLATFNVTPGQSIQAVINMAANGDTINVAAGTYREQLSVTKNLTFNGAGSSSTTVMIPDNPTTSSNTSTVNVVEIEGGATDTITGFTFAGPSGTAGGSTDIGVFVGGNSNLNISNCSIVNIQLKPLRGTNTGFGIAVGSDTETGQATVTNCIIVSYQKAGIVATGASSRLTATGNVLTGLAEAGLDAQNGIQVGGGAVATLRSNTATNNRFSGPGSGPDIFNNTQSAGILLLGSGNGTVVEGNTVTGNDIGIYSNPNGTATLTGNQVNNNRFEGLLAEQGTTTVSQNTFTGSAVAVDLVAFNATSGATANSVLNLNNNIIKDSGTGIGIQRETGSTFTVTLSTANNQIVNNTIGINNTTTVPITAAKNFYGSLAGPINAANPQGRGNSVVGNVNFNQWAASTAFICFVNNAGEVPSYLYVAALYNVLLKRMFDDPGICSFAPLLVAGTATREQVSTFIRKSAEYYTNEVQGFYQTFLGRAADPGGLNSFVLALLNGTTENNVILGMILSPEYQASHQSDLQFLNGPQGLYPAILGRQGDPGGLANWQAQLAAGLSRQAVATFFLLSQEYAQRFITIDYQDFLGRSPQPGEPGFDFWVSQYRAQVRGQREVEAGIVASDEFFARSQNPAIFPG
jgi:parallel beta-helix repeat protein